MMSTRAAPARLRPPPGDVAGDALDRVRRGILEANIKAVETLTTDDTTSRDKGFATAVVAGTLAAVTALGIAVAVTATTDWTPDNPPPKDYVASQLGWGVERDGDEVTWRRCTSRIFCTEERVTMPAADAALDLANRPGRPLRDGRPRARRGRSDRAEGAPICPSHSEGALAAMTSPLLTPKTRKRDRLLRYSELVGRINLLAVTLPGPLAKRQCRQCTTSVALAANPR